MAIAANLESLGKIDEPLSMYQQIAANYPDTFNAPLAMISQVHLLKAKNQTDAARRVCETILTKYRVPGDFRGEGARDDRVESFGRVRRCANCAHLNLRKQRGRAEDHRPCRLHRARTRLRLWFVRHSLCQQPRRLHPSRRRSRSNSSDARASCAFAQEAPEENRLVFG